MNGVRQRRDWTQSCSYALDDARLSGTSEVRFNSDCYAAGCLPFGTGTLAGPDGDWLGTWRGLLSEDAGSWISEVWEGTGAYEGWTFVDLITLGDDWVVDGVLYQGLPPQVPPPVPASE